MGDEIAGAAVLDESGEAADVGGHDWLAGHVGERRDTALGGLHVRKDDHARLGEQCGPLLVRHVTVVDFEVVWVLHHLPVAGEVLTLAGDDDPCVRDPGCNQRLSADQVVQPLVRPNPPEEEDALRVC